MLSWYQRQHFSQYTVQNTFILYFIRFLALVPFLMFVLVFLCVCVGISVIDCIGHCHFVRVVFSLPWCVFSCNTLCALSAVLASSWGADVVVNASRWSRQKWLWWAETLSTSLYLHPSVTTSHLHPLISFLSPIFIWPLCHHVLFTCSSFFSLSFITRPHSSSLLYLFSSFFYALYLCP